MKKIDYAFSIALTLGIALPGLARGKAISYKAAVEVIQATAGGTVDKVKGSVFEDLNKNGRREGSEPGISGVMVSNGREVVLSKDDGSYSLPVRDEMTVFITKPAGYDVPVDEVNVPQFFYHHQPNGSPPHIKRFRGMPPTGPLPKQINFPLIKTGIREAFKAVISGDTQAYSNDEIGYVRDTLAKELAEMEDVEFVMIEGDIVGDDLGLFPRFKGVMRVANTPLYLVPGNHDMDFDAEDDAHSLDTFKREWGPAYYSFHIGKVHFVVLDDVVYPCRPTDDAHAFCKNKTYNGAISEVQMEWLKNDLAVVPKDSLIVLNMHIPLVSFIDPKTVQHNVDNREEIYRILEGRKALALAGHTHTLEHFVPGEEETGWGRAIPIPQIITGAVCGSWWSGDFTDEGIPMSYQRLGAPRGYMIFEFSGNTYKEQFKATGKHVSKQMSLSFLSPSFEKWTEKLRKFLEIEPPTSTNTPPVNVNDLPDPNIVTVNELNNTYLIANVWNGSKDSQVRVQFDNQLPIKAVRTKDIGEEDTIDPFAIRLHLHISRYATRSTSKSSRAQGFELWRGFNFGSADPQPLPEWMLADQSNHLWKVKLPEDLAVGVHTVKVRTVDMYGHKYEESKVFEVMEERPDPYFRKDLFK